MTPELSSHPPITPSVSRLQSPFWAQRLAAVKLAGVAQEALYAVLNDKVTTQPMEC